MSLWKRGDWYWADFTVNGERFRIPLDTKDWRTAVQLEKDRIAEARAGKITPKVTSLARCTLADAIEPYLATRKGFVSERTVRGDRDRLRQVSACMGALPLRRIKVENIEAYISHRLEAGASNRTINMDVGALRRLMKKAKLWQRFSEEIRHLPERSKVGRALTPKEERRLIQVAKSKPRWDNARLAMMLALTTTMRTCEIRGLQWKDVNFLDRELTVRRSKTDAGERVIPLNPDGMRVIFELRERAKVLCGSNPSPDWYVFPHAEGFQTPDPTKPMSGWRSAWRSLRKEADLPDFRFHDLRHHAITKLAESDASDGTIMSLAGHVSKKMLEHYSHIRREAKRRAVKALSIPRTPARRARQEAVTSQKHVTKSALKQPTVM